MLNEVLDAEDQQLVVLNGDLITGENAYKSNSTVKVDQIVGPIVERGEKDDADDGGFVVLTIEKAFLGRRRTATTIQISISPVQTSWLENAATPTH